MKISLAELDWGPFAIWLGVILAALALFLAVLFILAYRKK
jgi:hypothetical protein